MTNECEYYLLLLHSVDNQNTMINCTCLRYDLGNSYDKISLQDEIGPRYQATFRIKLILSW